MVSALALPVGWGDRVEIQPRSQGLSPTRRERTWERGWLKSCK